MYRFCSLILSLAIAMALYHNVSAQSDSISIIPTGAHLDRLDSIINYDPSIVVEISANTIFLEDKGPVNKIDLANIDLQFHRTWDEVLNSVPGLQMQSGALNTNRISLRGIGNRSTFSTTKLKAYLDDIPLTTGIGETTLEDLDLAMIESIEVSKGPTKVDYGSNLGGMIHFTTNDNPDDNTWTLRTQLGSFGTYQIANAIQLNPKQSNLWIGQQYLHSDGFRDNNEYDRLHFYTYWKKKSKNSQWSVFANFIDLQAEIPSALNIEDFESDPRKAADNWKNINGRESYTRSRVAINHQQKIQDFSHISTTISGQVYNANEVRPFNILDDDLINLNIRSALRNWYFGRSNWKLDTGFEILYEDYSFKTFESLQTQQGNLLENQTDKRSTINYFIETHKNAGNWTTALGLSFQHFRFTRANNQNKLESKLNYDLDLFPHLAIGYHGFRNNKIQFVFSRGLSIPNFEESLLPDGTLNPDIAIEKGWNTELILQHKGPEKMASFTAQIYSMYITDLLVARRTSEDAFFSINAGSAWMQGFELSFRQDARISRKVSLEIQADYTFTAHRFNDFIDDQSDFSGNAIPGSAPHQFRINLDVKNPVVNVLTEAYFLDSYPINDGNSVYNDAYLINSLQLYKELSGPNSLKYRISAGINNIFDVSYASMTAINARSFGNSLPRYYYPGKFRNFFVTFVQKI